MSKLTAPILNATGTHAFVTTPSGDEWECPLDYLSVALARGFSLAEPRDKSLDGLFDDSTAEGANQTGFDPAKNTADEVNAHLAEHLDAPGEIERVLALEAAGKDRKTVVDPRSRADDPEDSDSTSGD